MLRGTVRESTKTTEDTGVSSHTMEGRRSVHNTLADIEAYRRQGGTINLDSSFSLVRMTHNRVSPARYTMRVDRRGVVQRCKRSRGHVLAWDAVRVQKW